MLFNNTTPSLTPRTPNYKIQVLLFLHPNKGKGGPAPPIARGGNTPDVEGQEGNNSPVITNTSLFSISLKAFH